MLECCDELPEDLAVGGEGVRDGAACVFLFKEACLHESPRVLRDRFHVAFEAVGDFFDADFRMLSDRKQYVDAPVVGDTFEVPLQLPRGF